MLFRTFVVAFCLLFSQVSGAYFYSSFGEEEKFLAKKKRETLTEGGVETLIFFHQRVLSQADGPRSSFYPSSSQYMLTAVRRHGFTGFLMGADRLLRENSDPWLYPKYITSRGHSLKLDPVK